MARPRVPMVDRFWARVDKTDTCWNWRSPLNAYGYGRLGRPGADAGDVPAHRYAYELLIGPIPDGLVLDHLCLNRRCVNPEHLEPVTAGENTLRSEVAPSAVNARKIACVRGHAFTQSNTHIRPTGQRTCRTCDRERNAIRRRPLGLSHG